MKQSERFVELLAARLSALADYSPSNESEVWEERPDIAEVVAECAFETSQYEIGGALKAISAT